MLGYAKDQDSTLAKITSAEDKEFRRRIATQEKNLRRVLDGNEISRFERRALLQYLADTNRLYEAFWFAGEETDRAFLSEAEDLADAGEIEIPDYAA